MKALKLIITIAQLTKKTIGYGRNVETNPFTDEELAFLGRDEFIEQPMTEEEAEHLLLNDIYKVIGKIEKHIDLKDLNPPRQAVCINMSFNLGVSGFLKFKKAIEHIKNRAFDKAAAEMLDSRWAKQVGQRSDTLAAQMFTGEWQ